MCIIAPMRKFIVLLILFLGVVFVIFSFSELERTIATLQQGNLWYILLALLIQIGWFFLVGITYRSLYRLLRLPLWSGSRSIRASPASDIATDM